MCWIESSKQNKNGFYCLCMGSQTLNKYTNKYILINSGKCSEGKALGVLRSITRGLNTDWEVKEYVVFWNLSITNNRHPIWISLKKGGFPGCSVGKESACNAGDAEDSGLLPGKERSPGEGHGNSLQYSCLENRGAWRVIVHRVSKSQTRLKWLSSHACRKEQLVEKILG